MACQPFLSDPTIESCVVIVNQIGGIPVGCDRRRLSRLSSRQLQTSVEVEFEVIITAKCNDPITLNCNDLNQVQEIADTIYDTATTELLEAINTGTLTDGTQQ